MNQTIIFHGTCDSEEYYDTNKKSLSNSHWIPWLQKQLLVKGNSVHTPEVFEAHLPTYDKWLNELNRFEINKNTILVGHSCGGGFLLRWMNENPDVLVRKIILVAPWLDPGSSKSGDMFKIQFELDNNINKDNVVVFESDDDMDSIKQSISLIKNTLQTAEYIMFSNYGHFTYGSMKTEEFPELLEECLR